MVILHPHLFGSEDSRCWFDLGGAPAYIFKGEVLQVISDSILVIKKAHSQFSEPTTKFDVFVSGNFEIFVEATTLPQQLSFHAHITRIKISFLYFGSPTQSVEFK